METIDSSASLSAMVTGPEKNLGVYLKGKRKNARAIQGPKVQLRNNISFCCGVGQWATIRWKCGTNLENYWFSLICRKIPHYFNTLHINTTSFFSEWTHLIFICFFQYFAMAGVDPVAGFGCSYSKQQQWSVPWWQKYLLSGPGNLH